MPKYTFECKDCDTQFERALRMGEHPTHPCPACQGPAPRVWMGQGFGFGFAAGTGTAQANSGVAKDDFPTADLAVGKAADAQWAQYRAREEVKKKVREQSANEGRAMVRRNGDGFVEYSAGTKTVIETRKKLVGEVAEKGWGTSVPLAPEKPSQ